MSTLLDFPFATLSQLKTRLGVKTTDFDSALSDALSFSAAAIEAAAGRRLRRAHAVSEVFTGGSRIIRVANSPIVQIHWIRESVDRDFVTATEYEELVEGTDYVLESSIDGEPPGESGIIRRVNGCWLGSKSEPSQIKVQYTGGYKTDDEVAIENKTIVLSSDPPALDFTVTKDVTIPSSPLYGISNESSITLLLDKDPTFKSTNPIFTIQTSGLIIPTWGVTEFSMNLSAKVNSVPVSLSAYVLSKNGLTNDIAGLFEGISSGVQIGSTAVISSTTYVPFNLVMGSQTVRTAIENGVKEGHITVGIFSPSPSTSSSTLMISMNETNPALRPTITIKHRPGVADPFDVPGDLQDANLIQAAHDHYTRANPGIIFEGQRGVSIASGSTIRKGEASLLPLVAMIARRYRRKY